MIFKLLTLIGYFIFRPALVKQKHSIQVITKSTKSKVLKVSSQAFNFPDNHAIAQHHFKELGRELSGRGDGPVGKQPANASLQANIEIEVFTQMIQSNAPLFPPISAGYRNYCS